MQPIRSLRVTFDERMDNIARNLDMITKLHLDSGREWREAQAESQKRFAQNEKRFAENEKRFAENERRFTQVTRNFEIVLDSIKRLERIATGHEERLDDLENQ